MKAETIKKIASCKALQGKTVEDLSETREFEENLAAYWKAQKEDRDAIRRSYAAMMKVGGHPGYKLPAHTIDRLAGLTAGEMAWEFRMILKRKSGLSCAEREYIRQLGMQAYNLTVAKMVIREFPELEEELLPKNKHS